MQDIFHTQKMDKLPERPLDSDDWSTPPLVTRGMLKKVPRTRDDGQTTVVYDPFYFDGSAQETIRKLGFISLIGLKDCDRTTNGTCDCMNFWPGACDVICTNGPFSQAESWIPWLLEKNLPLILLLPHTLTQKPWFQILLVGRDYHISRPRYVAFQRGGVTYRDFPVWCSTVYINCPVSYWNVNAVAEQPDAA